MEKISDTMLYKLKNIFGFEQFRDNQRGIVEAILAGRDVFAVMPTGGGKSLCYQLPATMEDGCALVVSPLISLMKDQVDAAREVGIRASYFNSTLNSREKRRVEDDLKGNRLKLLYVSPERFATNSFLELCSRVKLSFAAVDEAHCVSEWGHEFRPDYLSLSGIKVNFPNLRVAAFTATATPKVQESIIGHLKLRDPYQVRASFDRPNLEYHVRQRYDENRQVLEVIRENPGRSGIIYRLSRRNVETTAAFLCKAGVRAVPYHAGLDASERSRNQDLFNRDKVDVVVATIAFGMGIDKSDIRYIVHADLDGMGNPQPVPSFSRSETSPGFGISLIKSTMTKNGKLPEAGSTQWWIWPRQIDAGGSRCWIISRSIIPRKTAVLVTRALRAG